MPSVQRGQVYKLGGSWAYRYYDEDGRRHQVGRHRTRSEASRALQRRLDRLKASRLIVPR